MPRELIVLMAGQMLGTLSQNSRGDLALTYAPEWRDHPDSYALSLSMPLASRTHGDSVVRPYLEGLLPDSQGVLERWARQLHTSARNPFGLLAHMGEDCAGAVQIVPADRLESLLAPSRDSVRWLSEAEVAKRLRDLVENHGTGRDSSDRGYFSLAGAQPKTVLTLEGGRWGVPSGAVPSTHILKPPALDLDGFAINEHLCLTLVDELGLWTTKSEVHSFDGETTIVVERYDRRRVGDRVVRVHQEDLCQAMSVPPTLKYEADGGPGAPESVTLLIEHSTDPESDVGTFLDALALNWAISGTDAHAKNFSILIGPGEAGLAPLYDIASALPYPAWIHPRKAKLAMRVGREYQIGKISRRHWVEFAARADLDADPVVERVRALIGAIPDATMRAVARVRGEGIEHEILNEMESKLIAHAHGCLRRMEKVGD
ncbi:MAG TPA: type II toxin-antitoxin system HipA family toxin [Longimicrobium sp.]|jgi:serine/threonine-protein kinase HipA